MSACNCGSCGTSMVPRSSAATRVDTHEGRGLCPPCYRQAHYSGRLDEYPRRSWSRDELMGEWDLLRSDGYTRRNAAERLGLKWETFDRAYWRARSAGDPRAEPEQVASDAALWSIPPSIRPHDHTMGRVR
jgi:transposase-like protein